MNKTEKMQKLTALHKDIIRASHQHKEAEALLTHLRAAYEKLKNTPAGDTIKLNIAYTPGSDDPWTELVIIYSDDDIIYDYCLVRSGVRLPNDKADKYVEAFVEIYDRLVSSKLIESCYGIRIGCGVVYVDRFQRYLSEPHGQILRKLMDLKTIKIKQ